MKTKITLAMLMCGIGAGAAAGVAGAAVPDLDVPTVAVKYDPATLETDSGARLLYARIAHAAAAVCPAKYNPLFVSYPIEMCREQAIARAVANVHNPRLAAVYLSATKHG